MDREQRDRLPLIAPSGKCSVAWLSSDTTRFRRGNEGRYVLRPIAAALSGLALALIALAPSSAAAATSPIPAYTFAQSSLAGAGFENVIAADPQHNGVVISGSDVGGLDRSTNFGVTWAADENGTVDQTYHTVAAITFDPATPGDVYAATDGGVAESTDDGATWAAVPSSPAPPSAFDFNGTNTSNPQGTPSSERCVGNLLAIDDTTTPHDVYAASFDDGVWMYNGTAWSQIVQQSQLGDAFCLTSLAWAPGGTLDVSTWGAGVFTIGDLSGTATVDAVSGAPAAVQELVGLSDGDVWGAGYTTGVGEITSTGWTTKLPSKGQQFMSVGGYVNGSADVVIAGSDNLSHNEKGVRDVLDESFNSGASGSWQVLPSSANPVSTELNGQQSGDAWWHSTYPPAMLSSQTMVPSSIAIEHEATGDDIWVAGYGGNWRLLGAENQQDFYPSDSGIGSTVNHQLALDPTTAGDPRTSQRVYLGDTDWGMFSSADGFSTQQGISDDQFASGATDTFDTVVDGTVSQPVVYVGVGNRDTNTQGDLLSAPEPVTSTSKFQPTGLGAATGGGRPLAVGVVDTSGTPTLIVAVSGSGMWTRVGTGPWTQDTSLFAEVQQSTSEVSAIATQGSAVYAYDPMVGVYRSLTAGAPGSWTLIWKHPSIAAVPSLMVDSSVATPRLWISAVGGLYQIDNPATATTTSDVGLSPIISGTTYGLAELNGQVFTTELVAGTGLELQVSDPTGANFTNLGNIQLSGTLADASSIAVANDGTVYIATTGSGLIVGTPVDPTGTSLSASPNQTKPGQRVTFTATVTALAGGDTPAGLVVFWNGTKKLGTATINASGKATFSTTTLKKGSYSIVAKYQGDANDDPSSSTALTHKVT